MDEFQLTLSRRSLFAGAGLAALAMSLPKAQASASVSGKLTVALDWFANPNHAPLFVAQESGGFSKRGLEVTLVEPADPNDPPKLAAAGKADIAVSYQPQLILQTHQGLNLRRIGALIPTPLNMLLALGGGAINSIADLKGKTIGNSVGGFEDALLSAMLAQHGLTLSDVKIVNVNFALAQSLMSGTVDAVIGAYRNYEINILQEAGKTPLPFYVEEHGVPAYDELIFVANPDIVNRDAASAFLDAVEEGVSFTINHPDEAFAHFVKGRPQLDDALNRKAFAQTLSRFAHAPAAYDEKRYARFAGFMQKAGLIEAPRPASDYLMRP